MKFIKQIFRHDPDNGIFGDCFPTCLSIVSGIDRHKVPHWHKVMDLNEAIARYDAWLKTRGLTRIQSYWNGAYTPDEILEFLTASSSLPFIFSGCSRNGTNHAVIAHNGRIVWDPSLDDSGIIGPMKTEPEKLYMAEWIVRPVLL